MGREVIVFVSVFLRLSASVCECVARSLSVAARARPARRGDGVWEQPSAEAGFSLSEPLGAASTTKNLAAAASRRRGSIGPLADGRPARTWPVASAGLVFDVAQCLLHIRHRRAPRRFQPLAMARMYSRKPARCGLGRYHARFWSDCYGKLELNGNPHV